ncbi:MAG: hypothetical protein QOH57_48 [Mycobacterium sp.]|jgi:hypothetical protein|nr:hypothetical protein [Mycobacterium sp.]
MTLSYQQQFVLDGLAARAAILNLDARHNRVYSEGDLVSWITCFRHAGASYARGEENFTDLATAFDGGSGQRLVTVDHEIAVDGVSATQTCIALFFVGAELRATGTFTDTLIYERGGWYFTARQLNNDLVPQKDALPV